MIMCARMLKVFVMINEVCHKNKQFGKGKNLASNKLISAKFPPQKDNKGLMPGKSASLSF